MAVILTFKRIYSDQSYWDQRNNVPPHTTSAIAEVFKSCVTDGLITKVDTLEDPETLTIHKTFLYRDIEARVEHMTRLDIALLEAGIQEEDASPEGVTITDYQLDVDGVVTNLT